MSSSVRDRYRLAHNIYLVPFVIAIITTSLISAYMLFDPAAWLVNLMQLTSMSINFEISIMILALCGLACASVAERHVFLWLARMLGKIHDNLWPHRRKQRKQYKILIGKMRV